MRRFLLEAGSSLPLAVLLLSLAAFGADETDARDSGIIKNQSSPFARLASVDLASVRWTNGFWADQFETCRQVTLPRLWELADPWAWHNMQVAAGLKVGEAQGCDWEDAWIYKWIESACYLYSQTRDPDLIEQTDRIIGVIAKAQQSDGYLATQITLRGRERFAAYYHHEVYTMGHLLTAACAHHRITGKTSFLEIAQRVADYLHKQYTAGDNPNMVNCPVNPSVIMGAVELYRTTGNKKYLELANVVINNRGRKRPPAGHTEWGRVLGNTDLNQDRVPLRESKEVVGHAVFWSYLFAGATDAYMESGDESLMTALERLWLDLLQSKMYITGGVSPVHKGLSSRMTPDGRRTILNDGIHEGIGLPYDLPNATAYNETCGQIGNLMWNWRMLATTGEARFADMMEQTLYNSVLSGINVSGQGWSYTNPLHWNGEDHVLMSQDSHQRFDPGMKHICCPTNLMRTVASWHGYLYTTGDDGLWVHHYGASVFDGQLADGRKLKITQKTRYPWDGEIRLSIDAVDTGERFPIALRIPGWADGASASVNGRTMNATVEAGSYIFINRTWQDGDLIDLNLPTPVKMMTADPRIENARGQVAVMRGPIVYCLESIDLPDDVRLDDVHLPRDAQWTVEHESNLLGGVTVLKTTVAVVERSSVAGEGYRTSPYSELTSAEPRQVNIRLIPYYAWNNRGEPEMSVWLPLW